MNKGTKEKSWKYKSDLSLKESLFVLENAYGEQSLSMIVKGVMIVFFSLTLTLHTESVSTLFKQMYN
jgi:hypothetical protein